MMLTKHLIIYFCILAVCGSGFMVLCQQEIELLNNPDFEQPFTSSDWVTFCGSNLTQSTDAYSGTYSAKLTNR